MAERRLSSATYWVPHIEKLKCDDGAVVNYDEYTAASLSECLSLCDGRTFATSWWGGGTANGRCRCSDTCTYTTVGANAYSSVYIASAGLTSVQAQWIGHRQNWNCRDPIANKQGLNLISCMQLCNGYSFMYHWWGGVSEGGCTCGNDCSNGVATVTASNLYNTVYEVAPTPAPETAWLWHADNTDCQAGNYLADETGHILSSCMVLCSPHTVMMFWWGGAREGTCRCAADCDVSAAEPSGAYNTVWFPAIPTEAPTAAPTAVPTGTPTTAPTETPTAAPTPAPTAAPTPAPTATPTAAPTPAPTAAPTAAPTPAPTATPTDAPTAAPTEEAAAAATDEVVDTMIDATATVTLLGIAMGAGAATAVARSAATSAASSDGPGGGDGGQASAGGVAGASPSHGGGGQVDLGGAAAGAVGAQAAAASNDDNEDGDGNDEDEDDSGRKKKGKSQPPWGTYLSAEGATYTLAPASAGVTFYLCGRSPKRARVTDVATGRVVLLENERDRQFKDEDAEVQLKVISNLHVELVGVGKLERQVPWYHAAFKYFPTVTIFILSIAMLVYEYEGFIGWAFLATASGSALGLLVLQPGTAILRVAKACISCVENTPPDCIRDQFWSFIGFILDLLPGAIAFMEELFNEVPMGMALAGSIWLFALLKQFIPDLLSRLLVNMELIYGFAVSCFTLSYSFLDNVEDLFPLFVPSALFLLKAVVEWVQKRAFDGIPYALEHVEAARLSLEQLNVIRALKSGLQIKPSLGPVLIKGLKVMIGAMASMGVIAARKAIQRQLHESLEPLKENIRVLSLDAMAKVESAKSLNDPVAESAVAGHLVGNFRGIMTKLVKEFGVERCRSSMKSFEESLDKLFEYVDWVDTVLSFDIFALLPPTKIVGQKADNIGAMAKDIKAELQSPADGQPSLGDPQLDEQSRWTRVATKMNALKFEVDKAELQHEKLGSKASEKALKAVSKEVPSLQVETRNAFSKLIQDLSSFAVPARGSDDGSPTPQQYGKRTVASQEGDGAAAEEDNPKLAAPEASFREDGGSQSGEGGMFSPSRLSTVGETALMTMLTSIELDAGAIMAAQEAIAETILGGQGMEVVGEATSEEISGLFPTEGTEMLGTISLLVTGARGMAVLTRSLAMTLQACLENFLKIITQTEAAAKEGESALRILDAESGIKEAEPVGSIIQVIGPILIALTEGVMVGAEIFATLQMSKLLTLISGEMLKYLPDSLGLELDMELDPGNLEDMDAGAADAAPPVPEVAAVDTRTAIAEGKTEAAAARRPDEASEEAGEADGHPREASARSGTDGVQSV